MKRTRRKIMNNIYTYFILRAHDVRKFINKIMRKFVNSTFASIFVSGKINYCNENKIKLVSFSKRF